MAATRPEPKFRRAPPAIRRESLIEATLQCLRDHGHDGVSVRRISAAAGVSVGLINHHFPGKASLVAAAYESLSDSLLESIREHALGAGNEPRARLRQFFVAWFAPDKIDPQLFQVWLVFWSMVAHSVEMQRVHARTNATYRVALEVLLGELHALPGVPAFNVPLAATGLSALLDGLWIEASLRGGSFNANEAIALCDDWVTALCAGGFANLRAAANLPASPATGNAATS